MNKQIYNGQQTTDKHHMTNKSLARFLVRSVITVTLVVLGSWLLYHNWQLRRIRNKNYTFTVEEANRLKNYPEALHAYGMQAWSRNDTKTAAAFFRQAVSKDIFYIDAWLRLAESEAAAGHLQQSRAILKFTDNLTSGVFRWQWPQMILAQDLGMEDILLKNANFLLKHRKLTQDTLRLLDIQYSSDTDTVVSCLQTKNLELYLKWLMRWDRVEDTQIVWQNIIERGQPNPQVSTQYTHYLLGKKRVKEARSVWGLHGTIEGITNAGFEEEITRRGFDWRHWEDKSGNWEIERVTSHARRGNHALQISFGGKENISFQHLFQIIPVKPLNLYRLTYGWKSRWITTDKGPFVEIYGYDQKGLYQKGPMITGTNIWRTETIDFTPPEGCQAVVVRLKRQPSRRFDSKISGTLWLDDFKLVEPKAEGKKAVELVSQ
jgi:tetratricopeptide (TPR) repeat protein